MKRLDFIKINTLASIGLCTFSFNDIQEDVSTAFLTGKKNPYLNKSKLLHKTTYKAFLDMHKAASQNHIDIKIISGFRSFDYQKGIWNRKYNYYKKQGLSGQTIIKKITNYSAIPGTSRHHWGTEIDIINASAKQPKSNILQAQHFHGQGYYCELNQWMQKHAHKFGFYQVYTDDKNRPGFSYEPWHYSFKPKSKSYLEAYSKLNIEQVFENENILGKQYLDKNCLQSYFESHVFGINAELL